MISLDKSMSLKLSKSSLVNVEREFEKKFVTHEYSSMIDDNMDKINKRFDFHQNRFELEV